ncbi:glycosyl hydrolase [Symbioplanes lichenis]|uniref:glycosyl hydrolase n=1 Tax=Symbioplanes lichenis TaxID=1629072 RepID=UPI00273969AB|nr:glycosyl hydrolase [Actinoplanes lichenis]
MSIFENAGRRVVAAAAAATVVTGLSLTTVSARPALAATTTISVNAAADPVGELNNPAWYQNFSELGERDLARVDELAPRVGRGWGNVTWYYDETKDTYSFNNKTFDQAAGYADRMLINFGQCDQVLMTLQAPAKCREVLKTGIRDRKLRYPGLQYIEFFNEPDKIWDPSPPETDTRLPVGDYYKWYQIGYSIINEVNAELDPGLKLRIGGPAAYEFDARYLQDFINLYQADTNPAKRLDFVSFHDYSHDANPSAVQGQKAQVQSWLGSTTTPVFVTEYGIFAGDQSVGPVEQDQVIHAAAMATLGNYYVQGGMDMPMHWVYEHNNPRKSMFNNAVDGAVFPYYNVVKMQTMLKKNRLATPGTAPANGIGVNTLATRDESGVALMTTNYQYTGTASNTVQLSVTLPPATFNGRQVRVQRYLVDATHSNWNVTKSGGELEKVEDYVLPAGTTAAPASYTLSPNAVSLVVLSPITSVEAEDVTPVTSAGDPAWDITDPAASKGLLSLFEPDAVGDQASYTLRVPAAGPHRVRLRMKHAPARGVTQVAINGTPIGAPIDLYSTGYSFTDHDLGVRTLRAGDNTVSFTVTAPGAEGSHSIGVDTFVLEPQYGFRVEAENRVPVSPTGHQVLVLAEDAASAKGYVTAGFTAVGNAVRYRFTVPVAGRYKLTTGVKMFPNRGICQWSSDGAAIGTPKDHYAVSPAYGPQEVGVLDLHGPGPVELTCTVTGKNAASSGYHHGMDYFEFVPADT